MTGGPMLPAEGRPPAAGLGTSAVSASTAESVRLQRASPILPVRSVPAALAHYRRLGFEAVAYAGDGEEYGFLRREGVELHLSRFAELDPKTNTAACYLYVHEADALHAAWQAGGIDGRLTPPADTPYGLREFAHIDPDGNLLRVGSPLEGPGA